MDFQEIISTPPVAEWLDAHWYYIKLFPSQHKEMVQVGALCYSNVFMHREELKGSIMEHALWKFTDPQPVFDLYISDFIAEGKKAKMLFVSAEKSRKEDISEFFKQLYDGSSKAYPNGSMMIFIPLTDGTSMSTSYRSKILFNHNRFNGIEEAVCIGGLQNLNNKVILSTGTVVTIQELLKSFHNASGQVIMVAYQKVDSPLVKIWQGAIESEIWKVIAKGEADKVFLDETEGIWFGRAYKNKDGRLSSNNAPTKDSIDYANRINGLLSSPPKKRHQTPITSSVQKTMSTGTGMTTPTPSLQKPAPPVTNPWHQK